MNILNHLQGGQQIMMISHHLHNSKLFIFFTESTKLFSNTSKRIFSIFKGSPCASLADVSEQSQTNGNTQTLVIGPTPYECRDDGIFQKTETFEVTITSRPKIPYRERIQSEKSFIEFSQRNVILTVNELEVRYNQKLFRQNINSKPTIRRTASL